MSRYIERMKPSTRFLSTRLSAQLLYLSKRACSYIYMEVSFLCTRAIGTDTDDYNNMERVMKYIQGTIVLTLILSINNSGNINWYVYSAFALHRDMRSHIGGFMTMVTIGAYFQSTNTI